MSYLLRAWLVTAVTDGLFSSALAAFAYGSTVTRLWQGVAAVLLGAASFDGGTRTAAIGLLMHFGVALAWSAVFLLLVVLSPWLRDVLGSPYGVIAVASVYGPLVWVVMSMAVIPLFTHRPTTINTRWWIQFFGHIPFVAFPIVALLAPPPSLVRHPSSYGGPVRSVEDAKAGSPSPQSPVPSPQPPVPSPQPLLP